MTKPSIPKLLMLFLTVLLIAAPTSLSSVMSSGPQNEFASTAPRSGGNLVSEGVSTSGTGTALPVTLSGLATDSQTLYLDSSASSHWNPSTPSDWERNGVVVRIDDLHQTTDNVLSNGLLNEYHAEKWLGYGYNSEDILVPNSWTLTDTEVGGGSGRNAHPHHGMFEIVDNAGAGYDDSMGWILEAIWNSGNLLESSDEVYLSQTVQVTAQDVTSARVRFLYYPMSTCDL
ncbi:MAG: hypothetical protein ACFFAZ_14210, partial [Promethearchaeota archaeon]